MDVTCPRCQTDYEFDDALVSERGTTVKCTNCGHQFRVFRPRSSPSGAPAPPTQELWRIERREGEPLELRSLVELQRAIRAGRVSKTDLLRRGDGAPRRVGDIPELEPFFPASRVDIPQNTLPLPSVSGSGSGPNMPPANRAPAHTPAYGRASSAAGASAPGASNRTTTGSGTLRPPGAIPAPPQTNRLQEGSQPGVERPRTPPPPRPDTNLRTPLGLSPYSPNEAGSAPPQPQRNTPLPPLRTPPPHMKRVDNERVSLSDLAADLPGTHGAPHDEVEPPTRRRLEPRTPSRDDSKSVPSREELYDSLFPTDRPPKRGGAGKWIVALVVVAGLGVVAATVGRPYLVKIFPGLSPSSSSANGAGRLSEAIAAGDRARTEGDYTVAREAYLRATVIDDKSLAAWDGYCTAESELSMVHWIAALSTGSSLERDQAQAIGGSAGKTCQRWGELSRATQEGSSKASSDLRPVRALAAQGNASALRLYLPAHPNEPIVEAMVILADVTKQDAPAINAAAKQAAAAVAKFPLTQLESPGDVALAAYVAGVAGQGVRLHDALEELSKRAPRHMLLETLKQLGAPAGADAGAEASTTASSPTSTTSTTSTATTVAKNDPTGKPIGTGANTGSAPGISPGDYRDLDKKGHEALAQGDATRAETMFNAALQQNPGDIDALYGLGQIERSRNNHAGAMSYFKQVLDRSPGFSPARLSLADEQWATGNQGEAISNYKIYLESTPTGSGADRARKRVGETDGTNTEHPKPKDTE